MLVVGQIVVALVLVVTAALFARSLGHLVRVPLGYDRDHVLVARVTASTVPAVERNRFYHRLAREVAAAPGVRFAGGSLAAPFLTHFNGDMVVSPPEIAPRPNAIRISQLNYVTPGWLEAYGLAVRDGRTFDTRDDAATANVMIVNEAFGRHVWPGRPLVGERLALTVRLAVNGDIPAGTATIVGVVGDAVFNGARDRGQPALYFPLAQRTDPLLFANFFIGVRSAMAPALVARSVSEAIARVSPESSVSLQPLSSQADDSLAQDRMVAALSMFFGMLALVLAAIGLYGVTTYAVARRQREIGIRMALGAGPSGVMRLVLARVTMLVGAGIAIGTVVSFWSSTLVASLLYGVLPRDAMTLAGAALMLAAVALVAAGIPAWQASRLDPAEVLRER